MGTYIIRRLLTLPLMLLGVSVAVFIILHLIPGDPARMAAGPDATEQDVAQIRANYGLDQPLPVQYGIYLKKIAQGDLGDSFQTLAPVTEGIARTFPATLELTVAGMLVALVLGVPLGIYSALNPRGAADRFVTSLAVLGISIPGFFLGLVLMLVFASMLGWVPPTGRGTWRHLVLPALTLGLPYVAAFARLTRSNMLDILSEDFIRTARAKGLSWTKVTYRHAMRNASIPIVTMLGLDFGRLLGGAAIVETVFAWPGMGRYMVEAIMIRDIYVIQGTILVFALSVVAINLFVDVIYGIIDPRITYS
ncbi:ABC transporter permease [Bosea sp. Root670]|uniref:Peptide/nickel transport system permease protein/glutathione transport system permease protein/oligopeptide transport system permease protein n=1 Tax=Bosea robiniae TaxID=1036780 RepID=A0ABY0P398_9HYPH|nr:MULTISPECIES: ABC transporter permease [Bosea]KRE06249.1 ABC transporter permease [Bosea sp. Root670]TQI75298.1 peptide/nickel transport system permease protein/glutathione transport system permease protein/oligopeptide transport system permease protein [Bosea sp. AK1]SDG84260.1 peptide/nickel transport system permease protein/glutathione transport system permease protein/oligopeptide transport system permease protein [Bosea robiniae]